MAAALSKLLLPLFSRRFFFFKRVEPFSRERDCHDTKQTILICFLSVNKILVEGTFFTI